MTAIATLRVSSNKSIILPNNTREVDTNFNNIENLEINPMLNIHLNKEIRSNKKEVPFKFNLTDENIDSTNNISFNEGTTQTSIDDEVNLREPILVENFNFILEDNPIILEEQFFPIHQVNSPKFYTDGYRRIFTQIIKKDYSNDILNNLILEEENFNDCLKNHSITEKRRSKMIDWMIEVLTNYNCEDNTFFIAVNIMDKYLKISKNFKILDTDLHLIGVTSMFMASKYQDNNPLRVAEVHEQIAHSKLSVEEIKYKEQQILKALNYSVAIPTQWDFINMYVEEIFFTDASLQNNYLTHAENNYRKHINELDIQPDSGIANNLFNKKYTLNMINLINHLNIYISKMNCFDYSLLNYKPSLIAASTFFVSMKICEQINMDEYVNEIFIKRLSEISQKNENEIIKCAQKILHNTQYFETIFSGLETLKLVHFNAIVELKCTK